MTNERWRDADRLFPADPATRSLARGLYDLVSAAPIVSPHGHVDPRILLDDAPFADPATLLVSSDHYVTRLLHSSGIPLDRLGVGSSPSEVTTEPREVWRAFCAGWPLFAGTASGYWLRDTLAGLFGVDEAPSPATADALYDRIAAALALPEFAPRALFRSFGIEVLATTDDPLDDLSAHATLRADQSFPGRVLPTFRPDAYLDPSAPGWAARVDRLASATGGQLSYRGYIDGLEQRRRYFVEHGAVSADHGVEQPYTVQLSAGEAPALFDRALAGELDAAGIHLFRGHMLLEMARMSVADGLVMTVHAGVLRNHHSSTLGRFGPDTGHDIPVATSMTGNLRPLLERYGTEPGFHLVLFAIDESLWSRELAPLAGFYPSVFIGAPWWFLDAPDAILRFRSAVTETAGFSRGSGFIDDTRAFLSIPARHDASRRLDSGYLARMVAEGRFSLGEAERIAVDLVGHIPRTAFKL